ncbi:MAG: EVE domain-containing protein [Leptospirales bacterium]
MNYWLFKTEPSGYSWNDLKAEKNKITEWDGVRNYQARNFMRSMQKGDLVFFYHSVVKPQVICGICEVVKEAYPDTTQFDPDSKYFDIKSPAEEPRWSMVDIQWKRDFTPPISREELKTLPDLQDMVLMQKGSRLSIQPVTPSQWKTVEKLRP